MASRVARAMSRRAAPPEPTDSTRGVAHARRDTAVRLLAIVFVFATAAAFGYLRQIPAPSVLAAEPVPPPPGDARIALFNAADHVKARMSAGGGGLSFAATQIQLLRPEPGGPVLLQQPDRDNPRLRPTPVDQIILGSLSGRGSATSESFFAEWFNGTDALGLPIFDGEPAYTSLAHEGELWRRDERSDSIGLGWLATPDIPGFGVDPASLRELPELLRRLQDATYLGRDADGHHWSGASDAIWYPGAVAIDGAPFTGSPISIEIWLDDADRLVALFAVARNINETTYQFLCLDRVTFEYPEQRVPIPTEPARTP